MKLKTNGTEEMPACHFKSSEVKNIALHKIYQFWEF